RQCELCRRCIRFARDRLKLAAAYEVALPDRRIRHDRHLMLAAERGEAPLDRAFAQVIEDLVRGALLALGNDQQLFDVVDVEVGNTPADDLAVAPQALERSHRLSQRDAAAPVQQIQVETVGSEALEAALAGGDRARRAGIMRINLAHKKNAVTLSGDGFTHELFS